MKTKNLLRQRKAKVNIIIHENQLRPLVKQAIFICLNTEEYVRRNSADATP